LTPASFTRRPALSTNQRPHVESGSTPPEAPLEPLLEPLLEAPLEAPLDDALPLDDPLDPLLEPPLELPEEPREGAFEPLEDPPDPSAPGWSPPEGRPHPASIPITRAQPIARDPFVAAFMGFAPCRSSRFDRRTLSEKARPSQRRLAIF
jgi:hypothetical protein